MRFSLRQLLICVAWCSVALAMMSPLLHIGPRSQHPSQADDLLSAASALAYFFAGIPLSFGIGIVTGRWRLACWTIPLAWPILGMILLALWQSPIFLP